MAPTPRRAAQETPGRLRPLTDAELDLIRRAHEPGFQRWQEQIAATGGCARPVFLAGHSTRFDPSTGEVMAHYSTADEPDGRMPVRCRNRRATRCRPCSYQYQGDTFQLVRAGLVGGKNVPPEVAEHPRLFVTLTAPSFGAVHRTTTAPAPCRPRRGRCEHGQPLGCPAVHDESAGDIGQPLCAACYDYPAHILWHAHTRHLWDRFTRTVRRALATSAGIVQAHFPGHARVSFAKVAEYQRRGAVHFHAVVRLDGPDGPGSALPAWSSPSLLSDAVRRAAASVSVETPYSPALGTLRLTWGRQIDIRDITRAHGDVSAEAVAGYVAKYTTKSVTDSGALDSPVESPADIRAAVVTDHVRVLLRTCWTLGGLPEFEPLRLRAWAHTLGYRGHCLTKSRAYSTTYAALRAARSRHRGGLPGDLAGAGPLALAEEAAWAYAGSGLSPGGRALADSIADTADALREYGLLPTSRPGSGDVNG